jgi:recombination protein RecT
MSSPNEIVENYKIYEAELREAQREQELAKILSATTVNRDAFMATAIVAVKRNPDLLRCDRRTLHNAVTAAAQDGLMPDGKEGVIIPQWEKIKVNGREQSILTARWQPMIHGIRKRARELGDVIIDAQVVHDNDYFDWAQGDNPHIDHKPEHRGERGPMICAYAIFRKGNEILHREVMLAYQIDAVKSISKQPNGVMWKNFEDEAWRKSVVRRGIKSVPSCPEKLRTIIERFDDLHTVDPDTTPALPPPDAAPRQIDAKATPQAAPSVDARATQRQRMIALRGGKAAEPLNPHPEPERSPEERMLDQLDVELERGSADEVQAAWAARIMGWSTEAREAAVEKIQAAKARTAVA